MTSEFHDQIDSESDSGYVVSIFERGDVVGLLVATTYSIAEELVGLILEEDGEEELDGCSILPVKFDTLNQFASVH